VSIEARSAEVPDASSVPSPIAPEAAQSAPDRRKRELVEAWQRTASFALLIVPVLGSLLVSFLVTPEALETGRIVLSPPCTFKTLFGIPCLSCGMTRAFAALSHGQLALAWSYNLLAFPLYLTFWGLLVWGVHGLVQSVRDLVRTRRRLDARPQS
jgi:hypothetical protein